MTRIIPTRTAGAQDATAVQSILARAFQDDPAISFLWPDPAERRRRLPAFFALMWAGDLADGGTCVMTEGGEAATLWLPPKRRKASPWSMLLRLPMLWRIFGSAIPRALATGSAMEAHQPRHPHHYLHFAGCAPEHQGKGFGGGAIRAGIARAEADGLPCYLETATPENVPLYRALGFRVTAEWDVKGELHFWGMERPRTAPHAHP